MPVSPRPHRSPAAGEVDRSVRVAGPSRRAGRRVGSVVALVVAVITVVAACGSASTPTPAPSAVGSPFPEASFTGGPASARLDIPARTEWDGGWCARGVGDAWLALNVGVPNGEEYFGLVVGRSPYTATATRAAAGGGTFGGDDAVITWRHAGAETTVAGSGLVVELAADLSLGSFEGRLPDGTEVRGSFSC